MLLFVGLKTMSASVTENHPAIVSNFHCVTFKVSITCSFHFSIRYLLIIEMHKTKTFLSEYKANQRMVYNAYFRLALSTG